MVGIDLATTAQLAVRPYHVITVIEVGVTPARGGREGAVEKLKARRSWGAITDLGEGASGAGIIGGTAVKARKLHAGVIAWFG